MQFSQEFEADGYIRAQAHEWLAQFAPLVLMDEAPSREDVDSQLVAIEKLRTSGRDLTSRLAFLQSSEDQTLADTLNKAYSQLDSIESDLRRRLAKIAPGDLRGQVDLTEIQEKLAEREARQELGVSTMPEPPPVLELVTSPSNPAGAIGVGIFGMGWTAFTVLHSVLMIGGMFKAFGWGALALLLFYSIFYAVGFGMLATAVNLLSTETIELNGRTLKIKRVLGGWVREKSIELNEKTRARVGTPCMGWTNNNKQTPTMAIILTDAAGKEVSIGTGASLELRGRMADQINHYLDVNG
jgi:hypothetical protein